MKIKKDILFNNISIVFIIANLFLVFGVFRTFRSNLLLALVLLVYIIYRNKIFLNELNKTRHVVFIVFVLIEILSLLSLFLYPLSREFVLRNPIMIFQGLSYLLIPQLFFYTAGSIIGSEEEKIRKNVYYLICINFIMITIGLILHFVKPSFFLSFQHRILGELFEFYNGKYPRLTSYIGNSMILGVISSVSTILTLEYLRNSYKKYIFLIIFITGVVLSLQRGAWVSLVIGFFLYFILYVSKSGLRFKANVATKLLVIIPIVVIPFFIFISGRINLLQLTNRIKNIGNALLERMVTWDNAFTILKENPFGAGLGVLSHKAASLGFVYAIPDANYFRIAGENGVLGILVFLIMSFLSLIISLRKRLFAIFVALIIFYFQAIGTNVFDLYYSSFIFWFLLGIVFKQSK